MHNLNRLLHPNAKLISEIDATRVDLSEGDGVSLPNVGDLVFVDQGFTSADGRAMYLVYCQDLDGSTQLTADLSEDELKQAPGNELAGVPKSAQVLTIATDCFRGGDLDATTVVRAALELVKFRQTTSPTFNIYSSCASQLEYLLAVLEGQLPRDLPKLQTIVVGHYGVREFMESDPELARALIDAQSIASTMAKGLKVQ
jgi:hypothetical protein